MPSENKQAIGNYFHDCSKVIQTLFQACPPTQQAAPVENEGFYRTFDLALTDVNPRRLYANESLWQGFSLWAMRHFLTQARQDKIKMKMVPLPAYEKKEKQMSASTNAVEEAETS